MVNECILKPPDTNKYPVVDVLQQHYSPAGAELHGLLVPYGGLNFADMGLAKQYHGQSGLTDTSADGERQLAVQEHTMIGVSPSIVAAGYGQLAVKRFGINADAHGAYLEGTAEKIVPQQDIAVEAPVIIVGASAIVLITGSEGTPYSNYENSFIFLGYGVFALFGAELGIHILQLLSGNEFYAALDFRYLCELGIDGLHCGLSVAHRTDYVDDR